MSEPIQPIRFQPGRNSVVIVLAAGACADALPWADHSPTPTAATTTATTTSARSPGRRRRDGHAAAAIVGGDDGGAGWA